MSPAAVRWSSIVARSDCSPLPLREFAHREGVNPSTLAWWRWKLKREEREPSGFAEVVLVDGGPDADGGSLQTREPGLVVAVGAAKVEVDPSSNLQLLRAVVEALA